MYRTGLIYTILLTFLSLNLFSCAKVHTPKLKPYENLLLKKDKYEKALTKYITKRTVRVIIVCSIYNTKTNKVLKKYYKYDAGHGTGTILYSSKKYSIIQTAAHVVSNNNARKGYYERKCIGFKIERRDATNKITEIISKKSTIIAIDKKLDVAILKVPYNFKVNTKLAKTITLGQQIIVIGYPAVSSLKGKHISYSRGFVATTNLSGSMSRWGLAAYFGNSGGAVWTIKGELLGTVVAMSGVRTLFGGFIAQQNSAFGPNIIHLRKFYKKNKLNIFFKK